jgi:Na+/melibiose symporter-like transporter
MPPPAQPAAEPSPAVRGAAAPAAPRQSGLPLRTTLAYGAGNFAFAMLGLVVAVNLQFFYTDYVGLGAGLVAWSLLFARVFDSFADPVMAYVSDRTRFALGRRRPYILGSAIPLGVSFYFLFTPPAAEDPVAAQGALLLYMVALYTLTYVIWTIGAIPYYGLGAELTDDYHERTRVIAVREAFSLAGLLVATLLPAYLIDLYGGRAGYSFMGAILGAGVAVFLLVSGAFTAERAAFRALPPSLGPYAGWLETLRNPHFFRLLQAFVLAAIAGAVPATLVIYVAVYVIGTPPWWTESIPSWMPTWSFYLLVYFLSGVLSLPVWNELARRLGKRATWGVAIVLATVTSAGCFWLHPGSIGLFTVILVFGGVAFGNHIALPPSMVADLIDWDEARTGSRREGSYFGLWSFATKFANAFTGFAALQVLEHVGYAPGVPQTETVITAMLWMYSWFPAVFYALAGLALARFRFSHDDLDAVQRALGRGGAV